jgi:hypothetical protein
MPTKKKAAKKAAPKKRTPVRSALTKKPSIEETSFEAEPGRPVILLPKENGGFNPMVLNEHSIPEIIRLLSPFGVSPTVDENLNSKVTASAPKENKEPVLVRKLEQYKGNTTGYCYAINRLSMLLARQIGEKSEEIAVGPDATIGDNLQTFSQLNGYNSELLVVLHGRLDRLEELI